MSTQDEALAWQTGVWDRMSDVYEREIDGRFAGVVEHCIRAAGLRPGDRVLDLGTGTGAVAAAAAPSVLPGGSVVAVDLSPDMLRRAEERVRRSKLENVTVRAGRAEEIPVADGSVDALIASLSLMYAVDRASAAEECARVLRPEGRFVAAVWADAASSDIVRFQQTAGAFAPPPPVAGVGPGALADPGAFVNQLERAGITCEAQTVSVTFDFENFEQAWAVLAGVTTANLDDERRNEAKRAVQDAMWTRPDEPRTFHNATHLLTGRRR